MKKYLILFMMAALAGFTSCSDDDDTGERIVGTWILQSVAPNEIFDPTVCTFDSIVDIKGDNTLTATFYFPENECEGSTDDGTWQKTGTSSYTLDFPGFDPITGTVSYPSSDRMVFTSETNVVFTFQRQL
ncbi:lipocalin family protein [Salinimicrobium flavum]|uniref:Lipocalin family protein n=1 Tax=Salinimicrobium flavum TaxID=1737065 RepID=A0ABW5ITM5_9FLAO